MESAAPAAPTIGMANPAPAHCVKLGGKLELWTDKTGAQSGWCHLPDGRVVEEWALLRSQPATARPAAS